MTQQVSKNFNSDLNELLLSYLDLSSKARTQQDSPIKMGRVVDNLDPQKYGRCKIMVYRAFEEIPEKDLPWATPEFGFVGSDNGSFIVPEIGSLVTVYFRNNDPSNPVYSKKFLNINNLSSEREEDYPNTMVLFESNDGEYLKINKKTKETVYRHASGDILTFDKSGDVTLDTTNSSTGNIKLKIRGNVTIDATGNVNIQATGTVNVESDSIINVDAPSINMPQGSVVPNANGPLQALKFDMLTGIPCAGSNFIRS